MVVSLVRTLSRRCWYIAFGRRIAARSISEIEESERHQLERASNVLSPERGSKCETNRRALERLHACDSRAFPAIKFYLKSPADNPVRKNVAFHLVTLLASLGQRARAVVPSLVLAYDRDQHAFYLEALGAIGDKKGVRCLVKALTSSGPRENRLTAAIAIGGCGAFAADHVPMLCETLRDEQDNELKAAIARTLGQLGDTHALETLAAVAKARSPASDVAFQAIKSINHPEALEVLLAFIGTKYTAVVQDELAARLDRRCIDRIPENTLFRIAALSNAILSHLNMNCSDSMPEFMRRQLAARGLIMYQGTDSRVVDYRRVLRSGPPEQPNPVVPVFEDVEATLTADFSSIMQAARAELEGREVSQAEPHAKSKREQASSRI